MHFCCRKMSRVGGANGLSPENKPEECLCTDLLSHIQRVSTMTISTADTHCFCTEAGADGNTEVGSQIHPEKSEGIKPAAEERNHGDICSSSLFPEVIG